MRTRGSEARVGAGRALTWLLAAALGASSGAANGEAPVESAAFFVLPTEAALGPFSTLAAYCEAQEQSGQGRCDAEPNAFAPGWRRGERGPLSSATTLRVTRQLGPHTYASCHTALRTARGWYVSAQSGSCEGPAPGETRSSRLSKLTWADGLGFGVLSAVMERTRTVRHEEHRWWGSARHTTEVHETSFQLCGMGADGAPRCSDFISRFCDDLRDPLTSWELGAKLTSSGASDIGARRCSGVVLPEGVYVLPFVPGWLPFHEDRARLESDGFEGAHTVARLYGPFRSLDAYCADPARFAAPLDSEPETSVDDGAAAGESRLAAPVDPNSKLSACERRPGPWNRRTLTSAGRISRVELLRVRDQIAGARFEECRVAISTSIGVFVSEAEGACQGVIGPGRTVSTRLRALEWLEGAKGTMFELESEHVADGESTRRVRWCGIGAGDVPSCSPSYPRQCREDDDTVADIRALYQQGTLELQRAPSQRAAGDAQWLEACSEPSLSRPLVFP